MTAPMLSLLLLSASTVAVSEDPVVIPLWSEGAPGSEGRRDEPEEAQDYWVRNVHNPTITAFLPPEGEATGAAMVICPGGGHRLLVYDAEGVEAAEFLNGIGVAAFVLKYRLAREEGSPYAIEEHAREDGLRAMRLVRSRAGEWGVDPDRVGIMGFSAGGEVASMVAFGPSGADPAASDPIQRIHARPDFLVQVYPGPIGLPEAVPSDAPPAFLLVANDDRGAARVIDSLFRQYRDARAPVEAHVLARGGHGFNMGNRSRLNSIKTWPDRLADWLADTGILDPTTVAEDGRGL
ncbi:alpha/beta hydrolase [Tautonia plasticadhaerens]|uniref:Acetylxylan esterase n=1 Tax=Tautonia plasticadhaerens TaxID=2527974 RepID=A0A518H5P1_9BACT|nr:alpha/beta hydrolase [Tautonia plasticadhaerens]QDV36156.1 Acetylxylan esterase precursor [Tautonia plasticadhaerens]